MDEDSLDRILANEKIDPQIKLAALQYHAQEGIEREKGYVALFISLLIIGAGFVYFFSHQPAKTQEQHQQQEQVDSFYSEINRSP